MHGSSQVNLLRLSTSWLKVQTSHWGPAAPLQLDHHGGASALEVWSAFEDPKKGILLIGAERRGGVLYNGATHIRTRPMCVEAISHLLEKAPEVSMDY